MGTALEWWCDGQQARCDQVLLLRPEHMDAGPCMIWSERVIHAGAVLPLLWVLQSVSLCQLPMLSFLFPVHNCHP